MAKRIEIEKKFYLKNIEKLIKIIEENNLNLINTNNEIDEYFTDINNNFIKNRTCLRIRKTNNEDMELTFKGKSLEFNNFYAKTENNINIKINEYNNLLSLLKSIGYLSYTIVDKTRVTYSKKEENIEYNVMIDNIKSVGHFVEFEILSHDEFDDTEKLKDKLENFVNLFKSIEFESADLPYRDFVAEGIISKIKSTNDLECLLFDLDGTLINTEYAFYLSFKDVLSEQYGVNISLEQYVEEELNKDTNLINSLKEKKLIKDNIKEEDIMEKVYEDYEKRFKNIITSLDSILNFELLTKLKEKGLKLGLVTTSKNKFIEVLKSNLKINDIFDCIITRDDVKNLKPSSEAYEKALEILNVDPLNCVAFEDTNKGLAAANNANINAIHINGYNLIDKKIDNVFSVDYIQRVLLILLNYID